MKTKVSVVLYTLEYGFQVLEQLDDVGQKNYLFLNLMKFWGEMSIPFMGNCTCVYDQVNQED